MSVTTGPIKVENLIYFKGNSVYEILANEEGSQVFFSHLFYVNKKVRVRKDFMRRIGVSITEKPADEIIDVILENL